MPYWLKSASRSLIQGAADDDEELVHLERLLQVVEGAELHRLDGAFDGCVRRHHHDLRPFGAGRRRQLANEVEAGQLRHQVVDDKNVEDALREEPLRLARVAGGEHVVAVAPECRRKRIENLRLVVHEENRTAGHHRR